MISQEEWTEARNNCIEVWKYMAETGCTKNEAYSTLGLKSLGLAQCYACDIDYALSEPKSGGCTNCPMFRRWKNVDGDYNDVCQSCNEEPNTVYDVWCRNPSRETAQAVLENIIEDWPEELVIKSDSIFVYTLERG